MTDLGPVHEELLNILADHPDGMKSSDIYAASRLSLELLQCTRILYHLQREGLIQYHDGKYFPQSSDLSPHPLNITQENPMTNKQKIHDALSASATPMTTEELAETTGLTRKQVADNMHYLRKAGEIKETGKGHTRKYALNQHAGAPKLTRQKKPEFDIRADDKPAKKTPVAGAQDAEEKKELIETLLSNNLKTAKDSLDAYINTVGDPTILNLLRGQCDVARENLINYRSLAQS